MTETMERVRLRRRDLDPDEIEEALNDLAERRRDERRDRELEDQHIMKLAQLHRPYDD